MKSLIFNRKSVLFGVFLTAAFGLNAQIESTHTDEKYNYTTVVYKSKTASDKDVLSALDNSIGMGDVVRVTVAPPITASPAAADKSKGEDIWLKPNEPVNLTASTASLPAMASKMPASGAAPKRQVVFIDNSTAGKLRSVNSPAKMVATPAKLPETNAVPAMAPVRVQESSAAEHVVKNAKAVHKTTVKKAVRRNNKSVVKYKSRKKGKQRYSCPRF